MEYYHQLKEKKRTITTLNIMGELHKHHVKQKYIKPSTKKSFLT